MFASFTQVITTLVLAVVGVTLAKPVLLLNRDDVQPPITNPTAQTVWRVGETQIVTWDVAALNGTPPSNPTASIILGTLTPDGDEHLMIESPLVSGFPILAGNVSLTVPSVPTADNYIVCLFGSSGDISPMFTIVGTNATSSTPSSSASASSSPSAAPSATASASDAPTTTQDSVSTTDASPEPTSTAPPASSQSVFSGSLGSGANAAAGSATDTSAASPSQTAATNSVARAVTLSRAHMWLAGCVVASAFALL
ncbi:hypothetical protein FKP32DRAFT_1580200 [Trametes sanguinea]|nr:hypothetical protein FKP32DRAFT_1580200 [Trametes sanguinea]